MLERGQREVVVVVVADVTIVSEIQRNLDIHRTLTL